MSPVSTDSRRDSSTPPSQRAASSVAITQKLAESTVHSEMRCLPTGNTTDSASAITSLP